jgi:hypothetical protein
VADARGAHEEPDPTIAYVVGGLLPIVVGCALVAVRGDVVTANLALVMVLTVVVAAGIGGRGPGAFAAVIATMSFDFFLTRPYLSLKIDRAADVETTFALLLIGLAVGQVAVTARRARGQARRGTDEIARLHRVAELAASGAEVDDVVLAVEAELCGLLGLRECRFERTDADTSLPKLERTGAVTGVQIRYFVGRDFALPPQGLQLDVLGRGRRLGHLVLDPEPGHGASLEERVVAVALADQLGAALAVEPQAT